MLIVNGEVVDPDALARNPFIQQVEADVAAIAAEEAEEPETPAEPKIPPLRPGERRIPEHDGIHNPQSFVLPDRRKWEVHASLLFHN